MRYFWVCGGFGSLALGVIGAILPVLPTTPFLLLAAACFSRGSPRWHNWLRHHRRFGRLVRDWEENRAISLRAKCLAVAMIVVVGGAGVWWLPRWEAQVAVGSLLIAVLVYVCSRPKPPTLVENVDVPSATSVKDSA